MFWFGAAENICRKRWICSAKKMTAELLLKVNQVLTDGASVDLAAILDAG